MSGLRVIFGADEHALRLRVDKWQSLPYVRGVRPHAHHEEVIAVRVMVDLSRCQIYAQCIYAAPDVFRLEHEEVLEWDYAPEDGQHDRVVRAARSCPVQAISYGEGSPAAVVGSAAGGPA